MDKQHGLSVTEVEAIRAKVGPNILPAPRQITLVELFLNQFKSPLIFVLIVAAIIMYFAHDLSDSIVIGIVLLFNAIVGTFQEGRAQSTLLSLRKLSSTTTSVLRDGIEQSIASRDIVPGDVIILREGDKISADGKLIEENHFEVNEASLTGESAAVHKTLESGHEHRDQIYKGTYVTNGYATAQVTATGIHTEIGKIARSLSRIDTNVPLKEKISDLSAKIILVVLSFVGLFLCLSILRGENLVIALETAVSITVSLIPEGLPVILTLVLAFSVARMSKRNALVKKLQAVEALGGATVIAVDKTGTITLNELCVERILTPDQRLYTVTGKGFSTDGQILFSGKPVTTRDHLALRHLLSIFSHATTAHLRKSDDGIMVPVGDPTELAFSICAQKYSGELPELTIKHSQPFDYHKKYSEHEFIDEQGKTHRVRIGAPENLLSMCKLTIREKTAIEQSLHALQYEGMRVIAVIDSKQFVGIVGMQDSIHPEAKEAIAIAKSAGIRVLMITGDHQDTAVAIARKVGLYNKEDLSLTGADIDQHSPKELAKLLTPNVTVFARVTPEHKLKIIEALRIRGEVVAMTGDGVNDAASLVAADLGIAMGKRGTEVAKDAADIILLDDNFKSITAAIKEGRGLYLTIKNVILYLFSTSTGEALTLTAALILGFPSPILPIQILWLNFVTDGFLDVALSMEPREHGLLKRSWKSTDRSLIDKTMILRMILVGITMAVGSLFLFYQYKDVDLTKALTISLTTLAVFQWFNAWNCRSSTKSLLELPFFGNWALIGATTIIFLLQIIATSTTFMQHLLHTTSLSVLEWFMCIGVASTILLVEEVRKMLLVHPIVPED
jgi:Ca2+-transporting ATPase